MIEDLKKDTLLWEKEQRERRPRAQAHRGNPGPSGVQQNRKRGYEPSPDVDHISYVNSKTHERRQHQGPSVPETPSPGLADGYPPGRGPPQMTYPQQPSPHHETSYSGPRSAGSFPSNSSSPSFNPGYPAAAEPGYQARASQEFGYPQDHGFPAPSFNNQGQPIGAPGGRGYPQPPQTAPPGPQR